MNVVAKWICSKRRFRNPASTCYIISATCRVWPSLCIFRTRKYIINDSALKAITQINTVVITFHCLEFKCIDKMKCKGSWETQPIYVLRKTRMHWVVSQQSWSPDAAWPPNAYLHSSHL